MKQFLLPFWEVLETLAVSLISIFLIYHFLAQPFVVQGASMEPNFSDDDYILIDEITYRFREPLRGEVIVFRNPRNESEFYIKRIVGLPGEEVVIGPKKVTIDGKVLDENYLEFTSDSAGEHVFSLHAGEYFVMGDNRPQSFDSRSWGPLKANEIIGSVRLRFWPLTKVQLFSLPAEMTIS
ncbi:MAG: signal peptidase I [Candidatus Colwellbacteria bacterium]|nr:signal peptidase I [Candidatus Colwellbacteria bacterium]